MLAECASQERSIIIITHYFEILESIPVDQVIVMRDGLIERSGGSELTAEIREKGFNEN
jgi:Fe-S cluster assembly ATPase SufC